MWRQVPADASMTTRVASVQAHGLVRAVQGKSRDGDVKPFALDGLHLIAADHDAGGRAQRRAAGIFVMIPGMQGRLLADHAGAGDLLDAAHGIGDFPVPAQ